MTNSTNLNEERERLLNQCSEQALELLNTFNKTSYIKIEGRLLFHMPLNNKLKDIFCNTQRALKNFDNQQLEELYNDLATSNSTLTKTIQTLIELDPIVRQAGKDIFNIGANIMDMETKEASIAEEIHNAISAIKSFLKSIVDFLSSKLRIINSEKHSSRETNRHSLFQASDRETDNSASSSYCSPTLNPA